MRHARDIICSKLIELVAAGAKDGEIVIGCSLGAQAVWDVYKMSVSLTERASNSEIEVSGTPGTTTTNGDKVRHIVRI